MYASEDPSRFFEYPRRGDGPEETADPDWVEQRLREYDERIAQEEFNERYENENRTDQ